jgi:hypothetical protein
MTDSVKGSVETVKARRRSPRPNKAQHVKDRRLLLWFLEGNQNRKRCKGASRKAAVMSQSMTAKRVIVLLPKAGR